jgi:hypothetical protein
VLLPVVFCWHVSKLCCRTIPTADCTSSLPASEAAAVAGRLRCHQLNNREELSTPLPLLSWLLFPLAAQGDQLLLP